MDRALKERIVGAIVLVALVVLVVPVFLDGPPDSGEIISERVPLPGQSDQKTQTVVLERSRDEPMPVQQESASASSDDEPDAVATQPVTSKPVDEKPVDEKPADEETPDEKPASAQSTPEPTRIAAAEPVATKPTPVPAATVSSTGMFAVQLGSFSNQQNAERLAADLRKQGFAAFLSQLATADGQLHRVRVGPQKDREAAEAMAARLAKAGHKGKVLPHP